jgi:hypothetical protein
MQMIATTAPSVPAVTFGKIGQFGNSRKTGIAGKNVRIELFAITGSIVLCAPSARPVTTVEIVITVTFVSF